MQVYNYHCYLNKHVMFINQRCMLFRIELCRNLLRFYSYKMQCRLEALNQILELLSTAHEKNTESEQAGQSAFIYSPPSVTSTTLLHSVHLQLLQGCFGLGQFQADIAAGSQLYHYQVALVYTRFCVFLEYFYVYFLCRLLHFNGHVIITFG